MESIAAEDNKGAHTLYSVASCTVHERESSQLGRRGWGQPAGAHSMLLIEGQENTS